MRGKRGWGKEVSIGDEGEREREKHEITFLRENRKRSFDHARRGARFSTTRRRGGGGLRAVAVVRFGASFVSVAILLFTARRS